MIETVVKAGEVVLEAATVLRPQAVMAGERLMTSMLEESGGMAAVAKVFSTVAPTEVSENLLPRLSMSDVKRTLAGNVDWDSYEARTVHSVLPENFSVVGKLARGKRGAWLAEAEDGSAHVVKLVSHEDVTPQISLAGNASRAVDSFAARTPKYEAIGYHKYLGSWYVQEFMPGMPAAGPSSKLIGDLTTMNERQAGKALEGAPNWSGKVMGSLYHDSEGWHRRLAESSQDGWALASRVDTLTARNRSLILKSDDIVHGDFQHYNALVNKSGSLTGFVDWDGAGRGDRGIDLARLYADAHVSEKEIGYSVDHHGLNELSNHIGAISGSAARDNFMGYWALQIGNFGLWQGEEEARKFVAAGHAIIDHITMQKFIGS